MGNIYLTGFMGTGKSAVGRELAKKKKWRFLDLDQLIELKEKRAIADIFSSSGEAYFRKLEQEALKEVSKENKFVVACGGGIVLNKYNIKLMKETGRVICLTAKPEVIMKRVSGQAHRPLLNVSDPRAQIELLLKLRAPYYAQAGVALDTSKLSIRQAVEKIIKLSRQAK